MCQTMSLITLSQTKENQEYQKNETYSGGPKIQPRTNLEKLVPWIEPETSSSMKFNRWTIKVWNKDVYT